MVERKTLETSDVIEFELITPMDAQNARIPCRSGHGERQVGPTRARRRGYAGALPTCGKTLFEWAHPGATGDLPFGAFPGTARVR